MASLRSEYRLTRLLGLAAVALVAGVAIVGAAWVLGDYRERSDQREAINASSDDALSNDAERFSVDVSRTMAAAETATIEIQKAFEALGVSRSVDDLSSVVAAANLALSVPAVDQIVYQNSVAEIVTVDRFGTMIGATLPRYDPNVPLVRRPAEAFTIEGGGFGDDGAVISFLPLDGGDSWLGIVFRADELAATGTYVGTTSSSVASSSYERGESDAKLRVVQPLFGSGMVAERTVAIETGSPAGWLPFALRVLAVVAALAAAIIIALNLGRLHRSFSARMDKDRFAGSAGSAIGFEQNIIGVAELDAGGLIVSVNQAYCEQVKRSREQLVGHSVLSITSPDDRTRHLTHLERLMNGSAETTQVEHRVHPVEAAGATETWVLEHLSRSETPSGALRILVQSQDITFRRYATWELAKQALHDDLTGLPNRTMIMHRLRQLLESGADEGLASLVGVMFIDVDRFKHVNDSLGHDAGDRLITHIGNTMANAVRAGDTVSRFGGDEFVVLCDSIQGVSEANLVAERIQSSLAAPFVTESGTIHQTLSIGIAVCRPGELSADELLRNADAAMYRAKELGRNRIEVFDEGMRQLIDEQLVLEDELIAAIESEEIAMYFQPIVEAGTYATAGFESLIRWPHPRRGLLTPGQFLPIAEEAGLQGDLDLLALKKTCAQMAQWAAKYPAANSLYVSANKVPKNFARFVEQISETLSRTGLPAELLVIEVVENTLLDDAEGALTAIESLKKLGVRVAIDDFGTGYSSLSYLTQFRPTTLKIDRAFVRLLPEDTATTSVVQAITEMALALDINVIAEGVETWDQAEALNRMGVPYFQGYLFGKPRPADEITAWFEQNLSAQSGGELPEVGEIMPAGS